MNTPTPRTNDQIGYEGSTMTMVRIDFARQLERELAEAKQDRDEWKAIAFDLAEKLERTVIPTGPSMFRYADEQKQTIARFNAKKG